MAVATGCAIPRPRQPVEPIDWDQFVRLVDRHKVAPLVHRSGWLEQAGAPEAARAAVAERARVAAKRSLLLRALERSVLEALASARLDAVVLKGSAISFEAYGDASARMPGDVDVLVGSRDVRRAVRELQAIGLGWYGWQRPDDPDRREVGPAVLGRHETHPLLRDVTLTRDGFLVELHWRPFENQRLMPVDPAWLRTPRRLKVHGLDLPTLPLDAHWAYLMVHGAKHRWSLMKWVADVPALAIRRPELAERRALEAVATAHRRSVAAGLLVADVVLGPFLTPQSRAWAVGVGGTRVLVRTALSALTAAHNRPKRVSPRALPSEIASRLAMSPDPRYRLDELRLLLLSAGRAHGIADPGIGDLAGGPLQWARRSARRLGKERLAGRGA